MVIITGMEAHFFLGRGDVLGTGQDGREQKEDGALGGLHLVSVVGQLVYQ
jgi:hypothetical protein